MTDAKYWRQDWTAIPASERVHIRNFMQDLCSQAGFGFSMKRVLRGRDIGAKGKEFDKLAVGGVAILRERRMILATHRTRKTGAIVPFKLRELFSNFFHEMGHVVGLELANPYEWAEAAIGPKMYAHRMSRSVLETVYRWAGGEVLAEIRGKELAQAFTPGLSYQYSYSMKVFDLSIRAWGFEFLLFEPDLCWITGKRPALK